MKDIPSMADNGGGGCGGLARGGVELARGVDGP